MLIRTLKLGTTCLDKATGLEGTLTHWCCDMGRRIDYLFQPKGINPETGHPVEKILLEAERLKVSENMFEEVEIPFEILGTTVRDKASGFTGMAVSFVRHINGCFHVTIQPSGVLGKTKTPIRKMEFDLRECEGKMITKLSEDELKRSKETRPSPTGDSFQKFIPSTSSGMR